jgi:hypothetical protein
MGLLGILIFAPWIGKERLMDWVGAEEWIEQNCERERERASNRYSRHILSFGVLFCYGGKSNQEAGKTCPVR